jgi:HlyD family secretion protein
MAIEIRASRRLLPRLAIAAAILLAAALLVWWRMRPQPVHVALGEVDRGRVERSVANTRAGSVTACRRAKLAPPSGGQIVSLPVHEGDRVRAGQVLLELWNDDAAAQVRASVQQADSARSHAQEACVSADVAQREADRSRRLHAEGLLADDQLDRAVSTAKSMRAACSAASADVERSQSTAQAARATMTRTVLRAPFAGVVAKITGETGEFTTPSPPGIPTPPAVDLIDDSCMYVTAPIDEVDVSRVRVGQPAYITIDAVAGRRFPGRVRRIAPYVLDLEKQARTAAVEVEFTNPADARPLLAGYSADVEIILDVRDGVVRIPTQALVDGDRVLVYGSDGVLEERRLETGIANWSFTEVRSGLRPGEKIVLSVEREGVVAGARAVVDPASRR